MTTFLLATLYAPLASWGDIAVGEVRGSREFPSRSAVLGLVAGALGLTRDEQESHDELGRGLGVAARADLLGVPIVDYHTVQTVAAKAIRKATPVTRRELLRAAPPETMVSRRTLRVEAVYTVVLWQQGEMRWPLAEVARALAFPHFSPYAGRKANVFALPMAPVLVEASTLAEALLRRPFPGLLDRLTRRGGSSDVYVAHDACVGFDSGLRAMRRVVRRDTMPHRGRWQFAEREMHVSVLPEVGAS